MDISKRYRELRGANGFSKDRGINATIPIPDDNDYPKGYVTRFFIQKVNDKGAPIYEVSNVDYSSFNSNVQYNTTSLRWRISGPVNTVVDTRGNVSDMGIKESNRMSVKLASNIIINLKLYLPNLVQFVKQ